MSDIAAIVDRLSTNAMLLEPREFFDAALVGATDKPNDHWPRNGGVTVAVYDREKCIEALMAWLECGYENALNYFDYNTEGAWVGEGTPTFKGMDEDCCPNCEEPWDTCPCPGTDDAPR